MRENFNMSALSNNMFRDLNSLIPVPDMPAIVNISTDGYQGQVKNEEKFENITMDVQYYYSPTGNLMLNKDITIKRQSNQKRHLADNHEVEFKKRRQNETNSTKDDLSVQLEEELLKYTHGICSYHWRTEADL